MHLRLKIRVLRTPQVRDPAAEIDIVVGPQVLAQLSSTLRCQLLIGAENLFVIQKSSCVHSSGIKEG